MTVEVDLEGADKLKEVVRALRQLGDKEFSREFYRRTNRILKPVKSAVKASPPSFLPRRGGLAAEVASSVKVSSSRKTGRRPGLSITASSNSRSGGERDLESLNRGRLRHPLFGHRGHWFDQSVKPGWFDDPIVEQAPGIRQELVQVLDEMAQDIAKKL